MIPITLLYADPARARAAAPLPPPESGAYDRSHIIADLNLALLGNAACMEEAQTSRVMGTLLAFDATAEDLALRRGLIEAFLADPSILEELELHMRAFASLRRDILEAKRLMMRTPELVTQGSSTLNFNHIMSSCSMFVRTYKNIRNMYVLMKKHDLENEAFARFLEFVRALLEDCSIAELADACALFVNHLNEGAVFDVDVKLGETLEILSLAFNNIRYVKPPKGGLLNTVINKLSNYDEKVKNIYIEKDFPLSCGLSVHDDLYVKFVLEAQIKKLTRRISDLYERLIDLFTNISDELLFYRWAVRLTEAYARLGLPWSWPELSGDGRSSFAELYDLTVTVHLSENGGKAVPNSFASGGERAVSVITGPNQSGKTTFLRSLGNAMILARCGLPVCAKKAAVAPFGSLFTHFQRFDRELANEGQLDTELDEMSKIVYSAGPDSVVLMNESFSSTGTGDALKISTDVLCAFSHIGASVLFVTHLPPLGERLTGSGRFAPGQTPAFYAAGLPAVPKFTISPIT